MTNYYSVKLRRHGNPCVLILRKSHQRNDRYPITQLVYTYLRLMNQLCTGNLRYNCIPVYTNANGLRAE